jgi:hypothetical protein
MAGADCFEAPDGRCLPGRPRRGAGALLRRPVARQPQRLVATARRVGRVANGKLRQVGKDGKRQRRQAPKGGRRRGLARRRNAGWCRAGGQASTTAARGAFRSSSASSRARRTSAARAKRGRLLVPQMPKDTLLVYGSSRPSPGGAAPVEPPRPPPRRAGVQRAAPATSARRGQAQKRLAGRSRGRVSAAPHRRRRRRGLGGRLSPRRPHLHAPCEARLGAR